MSTTSPAFTIGQTVRMSADLRRAWTDGRAQNGLAPIDTGVGRVVDVRTDSGFCGSCEDPDDPEKCPGPWYGVDFPSAGLAGFYGEHELETA